MLDAKMLDAKMLDAKTIELQRPDNISCWTWYDKQAHGDLPLWQNCLFAAHNAGAVDVRKAAETMYDHHNGQRLSGLTRREKRELIRGKAGKK